MQELLIATHNQGKLREFAAIFAGLPVILRTLDDVGITEDVEETGTTFAENARIKAEAYRAMSGLPTLADDSGLEVAALNGAPGVYSARYGGVKGEAQLRYLLEQMKDIPFHQRVARFMCVLALAWTDGSIEFVEGTLPGVIEFEPRGSHGFGYDPLFYLLDENKTLAELPPEQKNVISHRAKAAAAVRPLIERKLSEA